LKKKGIADEYLDHGFLLSWADAQKRQEICDSLGPEEIAGLFRTWWKRMALPLRPEERAAGYDGSLSSWQRAVSLTQIFDRPWRGREFFEEIIPDNRDRGRPDRGQLLFDRVVTKKTPGQFRPRGIQEGVPPSRHIHDQHFDRKPYGKEGRGCRTEGTFRNRQDFGVNKGLFHLPYWQKIGRAIHRRLLQVERVSHTSGLRGDSLQRVVPPSVTDDAEKAPALPFGPPRVMALLGALTLFPRLIDGLHNPDLRTRIVDLWGLTSNEHTASQMSYHRRRWRRKGLIFRPPKTQRDVLTPHGWKIARLFTGLEARGFRPAPALFTSNDALLPFPLRASWDRVDAQLDQWIDEAFPPAKAS
jgi:hypothetical protein